VLRDPSVAHITVAAGTSASTVKNNIFINLVQSEDQRSFKCYSSSSPLCR